MAASQASADLLSLLPSSRAISVPSDESVATFLANRYRADLPYTSLASSTLVYVNPLEVLPDISDNSARAYAELANGQSDPQAQPHPYETAGRVWNHLRAFSVNQAVIYSGISGSGKSYASSLITSQLVRLSPGSSKRAAKLPDQLKALDSVFNSFATAKTSSNATASRVSRLLELHFTPGAPAQDPQLTAAKVLTFGLDKSRVTSLGRDERSFNIFYQLLAGSTPVERSDFHLLENAADYKFLSLGSFTLPDGPESNDSIAFDELRASLQILGIKPKYIPSILSVLSAILLLGNVSFQSHETQNGSDLKKPTSESAWVDPTTTQFLTNAASLLKIPLDALENRLTNRTRYVKKEVCTIFLDSQGASRQRDTLAESLYTILFAFLIESSNAKLFTASNSKSIVVSQLDLPGFQSRSFASTLGRARRSTLIDAGGAENFQQFCINLQAEVLQHWLHRCAFDDTVGANQEMTKDNINLAPIETIDKSVSRIELLRGDLIGGKSDKKPGGILGQLGKAAIAMKKGKNEDSNEWLSAVRERYRTSNALGKQTEEDRSQKTMSIHHYASTVSYDTTNFIEFDTDLVDSDFISLLRGSEDPFIARLFSGPSLAAEVHPKDPNVIVTAQISSLPFRSPACLEQIGEEPPLETSDIHPVSTQLNSVLSSLLIAFEKAQTNIWSVICIRPSDGLTGNKWNNDAVKTQIAAIGLGELTARKRVEYSASIPFSDFQERYLQSVGASSEQISQALQPIASEQEWSDGQDYAIGKERVWLSQRAFRYFEDAYRARTVDLTTVAEEPESKEEDPERALAMANLERRRMSTHSSSRGPFADPPQSNWANNSAPNSPNNTGQMPRSGSEDLLDPSFPGATVVAAGAHHEGEQLLPPRAFNGETGTLVDSPSGSDNQHSDYFDGQTPRGDHWDDQYDVKSTPPLGAMSKEKMLDNPPENHDVIEEEPMTTARRVWIFMVYFFTWWIPSLALKYCGRMKRPDVRMAWREKITICILIFLFCCTIIFLIIGLQFAMCPKFNYAWNVKELGYHQGDNDYWVAVRGECYDLTDFWKGDHSDITGEDSSNDLMMELAGQDLTNYFPIPLEVGCPTLVTSTGLTMQYANFTADVSTAVHTSGANQGDKSSALSNADWYPDTFLPKMKGYHKGPLVYDHNYINQGVNEETSKKWAIYDSGVYDLTDYLYTQTQNSDSSDYSYLPSELTDLFEQQPGNDITKDINNLSWDTDTKNAAMNCLKNVFFVAHMDFRKTFRCQFPGYLLIAFTAILVATIAGKFLAALQLTTKKVPEPRDKFVILQVPCYTEGENSLKKTIDSLANLKYDDKRKLLFIICDGMIVGSGNDRPTPRIVLDVLGADPKIDPDPLLVKSVGEGAAQLNYGKVYSGLYEYEGHVLPYVVVVKVGKPSERSRPGNRGKRDSQVLLLRFLNRVHFDAEMAPLELEIYHHIKNVIGIDPQLYEYLLTVDADTEVATDSLTRLISVAADDSRIVGLCGETKLANEQRSWWTMIQVYEYFISHHLAKAFESLFGTVTCLPGCFSLYRIRTNDKGRPLVISSLIIDEYSVGQVDTLHKKNLLHLGEDRYFTTLILKHFPRFKTKFTPDATAITTAPDRWSILLSQRRRWINSTVHNLAELLYLEDMCGFCCFSMRFVVMIDLVGTIMLPATTAYLVYLIVNVATSSGTVPMITIIMICAVYGLQVIVFLLKRQWQFIGWLIIYLLAYPVYSFLLPVYSFWHMDDFSWGNTRVVVGEGRKKRIITADDDHFDDSMIPMRKFSEYQALAWDAHSEHSRDSRSMVGSQRGASVYGENRPKSRMAPSMMGHQSMQMPYSQPMGWASRSQSGSMVGSDYGGHSRRQTQMTMPQNAWGGSQVGYDWSQPQPPMAGYMQNAGNRHSTFSAFTNYQAPPSMVGRPQSGVFSAMGGQTGQGGVSLSTNPSRDELRFGVHRYLSEISDLMTVTKRKARTGIATKFPNANLESREAEINEYIDEYCRGI